MDKIDPNQQYEWEGEPDEEPEMLKALITQLKYEIVVLGQKKEFTFRCSKFKVVRGNAWRFAQVIIDSSKLDAKGDVELKRISYHPGLTLANVPFMVLPAPEEVDTH